jgi:hypothetical protein
MNRIEVYQGNTKTITCTVSGLSDLVGYSATLTVKREARDTENLFEVDHADITGLVITFETSDTDNTQDAGEYIYEVTITNGTYIYTVTQDVYEIVESVKY